MRLKIGQSLLTSILYFWLLAAHGNPGLAQTAPARPANDPVFNAHPEFSVVSVKLSPDSEGDDWGLGVRGRRFWAVHVTTNELIGWAYRVNAHQIEHAPEWFATERFDVEGIPDTEVQPTRDQYRTMLQVALSERFAIKFHSAQKALPVYVLSVAGGGLRVPATVDPIGRPSWGVHLGWLQIRNMTFGDVAEVMQRTIFERPVLDQTGQHGLYSFTLRWRADETQFGQMQGVTMPEEKGMEERDDIYTAAFHQLGVKIEAKKALVPMMVIDAVSHPTAN
jgi:uncharacterized protein (TIGR03435 family)